MVPVSIPRPDYGDGEDGKPISGIYYFLKSSRKD